jgi:hypothetical protein
MQEDCPRQELQAADPIGHAWTPPPTTTDQKVAAVGLTAKLTAYRPYERAQPRSHADFLTTPDLHRCTALDPR